MSLKRIEIKEKNELACPICYVLGECEKHCVEIWYGNYRPNHLSQALDGQIKDSEVRELLEKRYPTPESCFDGVVLVCWQDEPPANYLPLFSGNLLEASRHPQKWNALFHQSGPDLLLQYKAFIQSELEKPQQIQRVLQLLRKPSALKESTTPQPLPSSFTDETDPTQLIDDLMKNLI